MAAKGKMISRDAKRRIEVTTKKIADLQEYGIPCLFSYATTWTGGIFVAGDDRMTSIVKERKDEFLENLKIPQSELSDAGISTLILPNLPQPICEMNGRTLSSIIVGIGKDLNIDWKRKKPVWWPDSIPFSHPREIPPQFKGTYNSLLLLTGLNYV